MEGKELLEGLENHLHECYSPDGYRDDIPPEWEKYPLVWLAYGERVGCIREPSPFWCDDESVEFMIRNILYPHYYYLLSKVLEELKIDRCKFDVNIDASYYDTSFVLITRPEHRRLVFQTDFKVWNFSYSTPDEAMNELRVDYGIIRQGCQPDEVVITVTGGVADLGCKSKGVQVRICDYDTDGADDDLKTDNVGDEYRETIY